MVVVLVVVVVVVVVVVFSMAAANNQPANCTRSFVLCGQVSSVLWYPALRPFEPVQCASPGRGGKLIGVGGVSAM